MDYFGACKAMTDAGITDPESYEGKSFCLEKCPYPKCVHFEITERTATKKRSTKASICGLKKKGKTHKEIAEIMGITTRTVYNYLKGGTK